MKLTVFITGIVHFVQFVRARNIVSVKPKVSEIPGREQIPSGLLLLTMTAELFGQKLPDRVMRLPFCFHSIQVSFDRPRSTNKRAARSWHQLFPSQSQQPQNSPFILARCRAKSAWIYKSCCVAVFLFSSGPILHTRPRVSPEPGNNGRWRLGAGDGVRSDTRLEIMLSVSLCCTVDRPTCWT